jgi:hypothetical protein
MGEYIMRYIDRLWLGALLALVVGGWAIAEVKKGVSEEVPTELLVLTPAEEQAASALTQSFTERFLATQDLGPLVKEFFLPDFIDHYKRAIGKGLPSGPDREEKDVFILPGLHCKGRLLTEASSDDWRKFYSATTTFSAFGGLNSFQKASRGEVPSKPTDLYPQSVVALVEADPNLENMLVNKGTGTAVKTVEELRRATSTLEQACAAMRSAESAESFASAARQLGELMKMSPKMKTRIQLVHDGAFGLPDGTRVVRTISPIMVELVLVQWEGGYKVVWAGLPLR